MTTNDTPEALGVREDAERYARKYLSGELSYSVERESMLSDAMAYALERDREERDEEIHRLKTWVNDLQSGMYINCVYCGHQYGPNEDTPVCMADVLKAHVEQCPEHPMSKLKIELEALKRDPLGAKCDCGTKMELACPECDGFSPEPREAIP